MKVDVVAKFMCGFDSAIAQVQVLHPGIDLSATSHFKEVVDGKLMDPSLDQED